MRNYWNERYVKGGTSGRGSVGKPRELKWNQIRKWILVENNVVKKSVVDVGCGDLSFWDGKDCEDYTGIDISPYIIKKNRAARPKWRFFNVSSSYRIEGLRKQVVFCFDTLFHLMIDRVFLDTILNLCEYAEETILLNNWIVNPLGDKISDGKYQVYRNLKHYVPVFDLMGFYLPFVHKYSEFNAFYVFTRFPSKHE